MQYDQHITDYFWHLTLKAWAANDAWRRGSGIRDI